MALYEIYLNDHLAAAVAAGELARRAASSNRGSPYGEALERLAVQIDEDRGALREVMADLGVRPDRLKVALGWTGEKAGRLKLNGSLLSYSPLSRVVELEALTLGVEGKLLLWQALADVKPLASRLRDVELDALIRRARSQGRSLRKLRLQAAAEALAA